MSRPWRPWRSTRQYSPERFRFKVNDRVVDDEGDVGTVVGFDGGVLVRLDRLPDGVECIDEEYLKSSDTPLPADLGAVIRLPASPGMAEHVGQASGLI